MRVLLDANVVFSVEPITEFDVSELMLPVSRMLRECAESAHEVLLHPAIKRDMHKDRDSQRKAAREILLQKYALLKNPPAVTKEQIEKVGVAIPGSNDEVDDLLLAAVLKRSVDFLVTEDKKIQAKAARLELTPRVLSVHKLLRYLRIESHSTRQSLLGVSSTTCNHIDTTDPIFDSLRIDYDDFDNWFLDCREEKRSAWIIKTGATYDAICIIKDESISDSGFPGLSLKLCTFKIAESGFGKGHSELMLRTAFDYAIEKGHDRVYLTVFPAKKDLIALLKKFGFSVADRTTSRGELYMSKILNPSIIEQQSLSPLEYHRRYGPRYFKVQGVSAFIVPIRPKFHRMLFPDAEFQLALISSEQTYGNAIRKAYLCHSQIRSIEPGSLLLFYRSMDARSITCVGVVERVKRGADPISIYSLVNLRTVYSYDDIVRLTGKEVLAIMFRYATKLMMPITFDELKRADVLMSPPQSIVKIPSKGMIWLEKRLL